eukprot:39575-Eustigmatos_ZCMA.PRE.1
MTYRIGDGGTDLAGPLLLARAQLMGPALPALAARCPHQLRRIVIDLSRDDVSLLLLVVPSLVLVLMARLGEGASRMGGEE